MEKRRWMKDEKEYDGMVERQVASKEKQGHTGNAIRVPMTTCQRSAL